MRLAIAAAIGWPRIAAAQDRERVRIVGLLVSLPLSDQLVATRPESNPQSRIPTFKSGLEKLGWVEGRNIKYEVRSSYGGPDAREAAVKELIDLHPDVIATSSTVETAAVQAATRTIPIVFATAADPIGSGFVQSLARPGGNITGFTNGDAETGGKWVQFLKEIDPRITRIGVLFNPKSVPRGGSYYLDPIKEVASSLGLTVTAVQLADPSEIDAAVATFAGDPSGGLILPPDSFTVGHRKAIIAAVARHRVPAIYSLRYFIDAGGLISYGAGLEVRGAEYINLILRGAKPGDLPVQSPRKYELLINRKVAEALGLKVPLTLLSRADEIIE